MFHDIAHWLVEIVGVLGYPGVLFLMAVESSFFPFPSEVVMVPAGFASASGTLNIWVVILLGTLGSILGAWFNYFFARTLGRKVCLRLGQYVGLSEEHLKKVEIYFKKHGEISIFIGRLIPVVRQLISLPAGLARMSFWKLTLYTGLGAGIWVSILAGIGYVAGKHEDRIAELTESSVLWVLGFVVLLVVVYIGYHKFAMRGFDEES